VPLFIDRLPFHYWIDRTRQPPQSHWSVVLPVFLTEVAALAPPITAVAQDWAVDTANRGPAFAWRHHLLLAGLDPDRARRPSQVTITTALGSKATVPVRLASLWLISNVPAFQGMSASGVSRVPGPCFSPLLPPRRMLAGPDLHAAAPRFLGGKQIDPAPPSDSRMA